MPDNKNDSLASLTERLRSRPLRSHPVADLMRALNVSRRTLGRDLAALRDAGARIESDPGVAGVRYVCFDAELASVLPLGIHRGEL